MTAVAGLTRDRLFRPDSFDIRLTRRSDSAQANAVVAALHPETLTLLESAGGRSPDAQNPGALTIGPSAGIPSAFAELVTPEFNVHNALLGGEEPLRCPWNPQDPSPQIAWSDALGQGPNISWPGGRTKSSRGGWHGLAPASPPCRPTWSPRCFRTLDSVTLVDPPRVFEVREGHHAFGVEQAGETARRDSPGERAQDRFVRQPETGDPRAEGLDIRAFAIDSQLWPHRQQSPEGGIGQWALRAGLRHVIDPVGQSNGVDPRCGAVVVPRDHETPRHRSLRLEARRCEDRSD